jgi:hypothetical protein
LFEASTFRGDQSQLSAGEDAVEEYQQKEQANVHYHVSPLLSKDTPCTLRRRLAPLLQYSVCRATEHTLALIRPGNRTEDLLSPWQEIFKTSPEKTDTIER